MEGGLVGAMAGLFALVLALPVTREFFALAPWSSDDHLLAVAVAGVACLLLTVLSSATGALGHRD